jgi:cytosine/creatinine deaminase
VTKLSAAPPDELVNLAHRLADAGVAVTVLPATELFLMGRACDHNVPRGVTHAHKLAERGVTCSLATNNVLNPFTPFGDCSLVRMANLYANIAQAGTAQDLAACF